MGVLPIEVAICHQVDHFQAWSVLGTEHRVTPLLHLLGLLLFAPALELTGAAYLIAATMAFHLVLPVWGKERYTYLNE